MLVKLTNFQNFQRIANDKQKLIEGIRALQNKGALFDEQYCHGDCPGCQTSEGGGLCYRRRAKMHQPMA